MSAIGPKRTSLDAPHMSVFGSKPDMTVAGIRFRGRYWGQSGHACLRCTCLLLTQSGHLRPPFLIDIIEDSVTLAGPRGTVCLTIQRAFLRAPKCRPPDGGRHFGLILRQCWLRWACEPAWM